MADALPRSRVRSARKTRKPFLVALVVAAALAPIDSAVSAAAVGTTVATLASSRLTTVSDGETTLFAPGEMPSEIAVRDYSAVELGVRFSPQADGYITGLRFYKSSRNLGRHVGTLWGPSGEKLATVTFSSETASGWQNAKFTSPIPVHKGSSYTASYNAPVGRYSATRAYFTSERARGPLATPRNAGVYLYGTTTSMPRSTTYQSNYWVDVVFKEKVSAVSAPPAQNSRDPRKWPFSSTSIWNTPIGSSAQYKPLHLTPPTAAYSTDEVYLPLDPNAPLRRLVDRGYWWPWTSGTSVTGSDTGIQVRVPDNWIVEPPAARGLPNRATAALQTDGRAREFQYTVRPTAGSDISMFERPRAVFDLRGDGLTPSGMVGAHGGSGLTAIGGTVREGELSGPEPIRHALAVTMNMAKWGTQQGGKITNGYRWPAITADALYADPRYSVGYGTIKDTGGSSKDGLGMGTLLAIPADVDLRSLGFETTEGAKLAWTHQNFGAYVVDNSGDPDGKWDAHLLNVEIGVLKEFPNIDTWPGTDTPFGRDMNRIFTRLAVVDNNGPTSIGGGGTPRQPLAPPLASD